MKLLLVVFSLLVGSLAVGLPTKNSRVLQFQEGFGHDWGFQTLGVGDTQTFVLENTSSTNTLTGIAGSGLAAPFTWAGGSFPGTSGTCGTTLGPSSTCTVRITFTPSANIQSEDWAVVTYTEAGVTREVMFRVSGFGGGCASLQPVVTGFARIMFPSDTVSVSLNGNYFTSSTTVAISGLTVSNKTYNSPTNITFDITSTASTGTYDLEVTNECGTTTVADAVEVRASAWVDLRTGGDSDASLGLVTDASTTAVRDATGMYFTGTGGWGTYAHFTGHEFVRGDLSALEWVFVKNSSSTFMIGIGSDEQNFASASQWSEAEVQLYTYTNVMWGYYGNNGNPGSAWSLNDNATFTYGTYYKVRFNNDGESGNNIVVYRVTSTDWDTNLATLNTTASNNSANATNLRPMVLPNQTGTAWRAVAFRLYQ